MEGVFGGGGAQAAFDAIEDGNTDAEGSEIDAGYDGHFDLDSEGKLKHTPPRQRAKACARALGAARNSAGHGPAPRLDMVVDAPAQVHLCGFFYGACDWGQVCGYVVLEAALADVAE